jgi:hypothetical protein
VCGCVEYKSRGASSWLIPHCVRSSLSVSPLRPNLCLILDLNYLFLCVNIDLYFSARIILWRSAVQLSLRYLSLSLSLCGALVCRILLLLRLNPFELFLEMVLAFQIYRRDKGAS